MSQLIVFIRTVEGEETLMAKGMTQKKTTKKKPAKTMMEKRADKAAKKRG